MILLFVPAFLVGQGSRFYMQSDRSIVNEGETIAIEAILENIKTDAIAMPDFTPFKVVSGPSKSTSITFINGKKASSISYSYILLATQKGKYKINPASANVGSKTIHSNDLTIEVTAGDTQQHISGDFDDDINLQLEVSSTKGYIGQPLTLNYIIYTRQNISSYNFLNQPNDDGFYIQPLSATQDRAQKKQINGKEYYTQVIARQILFPQKSGDYTIGPINMRADVPVDNGHSSFFFRDTKPVNIKSNVLKIKIASLPQPQPANYCGAVGEIEIKASLQKSTVTKGTAIVLNVQIEGNGDPKTIKAPKFEVPEGLEAYDPSLIQEEAIPQNDRILVKKNYEYIFIPKEAKIYEIKPELSYFDPESNSYKTASAGSFTINVVQGEVEDSNSPTTASDEKYTIKENYSVYDLASNRWNTSTYLLSILIISFLTLGGIWYKKKTITRQKSEDTAYNKASALAQRHLAKASELIENQEHRAFYEEIASATTGYVIKKYAIPHSEVSAHNIVQVLKEKGVAPSLITDYEWIHKQAELARFAGTYGDMKEVYETARRFISGMIS